MTRHACSSQGSMSRAVAAGACVRPRGKSASVRISAAQKNKTTVQKLRFQDIYVDSNATLQLVQRRSLKSGARAQIVRNQKR